MEEIIQAKSGKYGRVQVTLLLHVKEDMLAWTKKLGVNQAVFLRIALMIGVSQLIKMILYENGLEIFNEELSGQPADRT